MYKGKGVYFFKEKAMLKFTKIQRKNDLLPADNVDVYVATEKVDGANFQIKISKDEITYYKRNSSLSSSSNFFNFQSAIEKDDVVDLVDKIKNDIKGYDNIHLFGELYGSGINKRIPYFEKNEVRLTFFDVVYTNDSGEKEHLSFSDIEKLFAKYGHIDLLVPVIKKGSWDEMMEINVEELNSKLTYKDSVSEGIVIRGYDTVILSDDGTPVYLKRKSVAFDEMRPQRKYKGEDKHPMVDTFLSYVNKNRVLSYFSKEGEIDDIRKMGDYIKGIVSDAWEDFYDDYPEYFEDKRKIISPAGKEVAKILKEYV